MVVSSTAVDDSVESTGSAETGVASVAVIAADTTKAVAVNPTLRSLFSKRLIINNLFIRTVLVFLD
ncbi:MAG: hypothetical protein WAN89_02615 [Lawsonella sp.]